MTPTLLVLVCGTLFLLGHFVVRPAVLWWTVRMLKAPRITFGRCLLTTVLIVVLELLCMVLLCFVVPELTEPRTVVPEWVLDALDVALWVALSFVWLGWALGTKWWMTLRVLLVWQLLSLGALVGIALSIRFLWLDAYTMPTGSMAPTLLGVHLSHPCGNCGFTVDVAVRTDENGEPVNADRLLTRNVACANCGFSQSLAGAGILEGDRFLIDRTVTPGRWDVTAYVYPRDPGVKYIHRLVGLPGETIEIFRGDIFANGRRLVKPPGVAEDMWIAVHDTDYIPSSPEAVEPAWQCRPEDPRSTRQGPGWRVSSTDSEDELRLEFTPAIANHLDYNAHFWGRTRPEHVSDALVVIALDGFSGPGQLGFEWKRDRHTVRATLPASGQLALEAGEESVRAELASPLTAGGVFRFGVRDGQAFVIQDDDLIATLSVFADELDAFKRVAPGNSEPCSLALFASRCDLHISWITVSRDLHYIGESPARPCMGCTGSPITLGENEYYVLGDNVESSSDSRYWGVVPGALIIGRLTAIFWPPERWRFW